VSDGKGFVAVFTPAGHVVSDGKGFVGVFGSRERLNTSNTPTKSLEESIRILSECSAKTCTQIPN
jgi:hypothetical protein